MRLTRRPGAEAEIGGFGGLLDPAAAGFKDPILVASTDGVGTKLRIALATNQHNNIGIDLVAMCVNDIVVQGAEPLFFLDYFATSKLNLELAQKVMTGIVKGCQQAGCALIGGETAEMPSMYNEEDYDLSGFSVGAVERDRLLTGSRIEEGDILLGLSSNGLHSNGFSLVRKIVKELSLDYTEKAPFSRGTLGANLLAPTRIYVKSCLAAHEAGLIKGLAHITGGGLIENIPRILPKKLGVKLNAKNWAIPDVFKWLAKSGNVTADEMGRTFNCGIGMVGFTSPKDEAATINALSEAGEGVFRIGIVETTTSENQIFIENWETVWAS